MSSNCNLIEDLEILSSWVLEDNNKHLKNTISLDYSNKSVDIEDVVQVETCIHLVQDEDVNNNESCTVTIKLPESSPYLISRLVIVSEARIIELYGKCEEYLTTSTADYVDDFEDCAVYMANCVVKPVNQLLIKFQRTKHVDSLWLYGIKVKLLSRNSNSQTLSSIDYQTVNDILRDSKMPISQNAEKCKAFLQNYRGPFDRNCQKFGRKFEDPQFFRKVLESDYLNLLEEKRRQESEDPQFLRKVLESDYLNLLEEKRRKESKCSMNLPQLLEDSRVNSNMPHTSESKSGGQIDMTVLKNYIDSRFTELEKRVECFEQKMIEIDKRQQEKLDCIIELLRK